MWWKILLIVLALIFVGLVLFILIGREIIKTVRYTFNSDKLPENFSGFRIVQVSDLHNKRFGSNQKRLMKKIVAENPDIIVVTGDLIHNRKVENALSFISQAVKIAPVYYVTGNHEQVLGQFYDAFKVRLEDYGVITLPSTTAKLERDGQEITVIGMDDPLFFGGRWRDERRDLFTDKLRQVSEQTDGFRILLSHRPELMPRYYGLCDLAITGHTHAGHVRLPFIGAFRTPGEHRHPHYVVGRYDEQNTTMIISAGLGSSTIIPRFNCPPEIVTIELQAAPAGE